MAREHSTALPKRVTEGATSLLRAVTDGAWDTVESTCPLFDNRIHAGVAVQSALPIPGHGPQGLHPQGSCVTSDRGEVVRAASRLRRSPHASTNTGEDRGAATGRAGVEMHVLRKRPRRCCGSRKSYGAMQHRPSPYAAVARLVRGRTVNPVSHQAGSIPARRMRSPRVVRGREHSRDFGEGVYGLNRRTTCSNSETQPSRLRDTVGGAMTERKHNER